ncbi:hypothetical protein GEMRC1_003548 [Eukaryota sp. GEM-RC1]
MDNLPSDNSPPSPSDLSHSLNDFTLEADTYLVDSPLDLLEDDDDDLIQDPIIEEPLVESEDLSSPLSQQEEVLNSPKEPQDLTVEAPLPPWFELKRRTLANESSPCRPFSDIPDDGWESDDLGYDRHVLPLSTSHTIHHTSDGKEFYIFDSDIFKLPVDVISIYKGMVLSPVPRSPFRSSDSDDVSDDESDDNSEKDSSDSAEEESVEEESGAEVEEDEDKEEDHAGVESQDDQVQDENDDTHDHDDYNSISDNSISQISLGRSFECEKSYESFYLPVIFERNRTGFESERELTFVQGEKVAGRYVVRELLGSAAFSFAIHAYDVEDDMEVCLKMIKNSKDYFDQSLDEIKLLKLLNDTDEEENFNIVRLFNYFYHREHLFLVFELLKENLYEAFKYNHRHENDPYFTLPVIQSIARQLLTSLAFCHDLDIIHSDIKPENILIRSYTRRLIKLVDFGSSCFTHDHLSSYVQSRSYRAPEVLLGLPYDCKIDIWSAACVLAELWTGGGVVFKRHNSNSIGQSDLYYRPCPSSHDSFLQVCQ